MGFGAWDDPNNIFSGFNQKFQNNDASWVDIGSPFTFAIWMQSNFVVSNSIRVARVGDNANGTSYLTVDQNQGKMVLNNDDGVGGIGSVNTVNMAAGEWVYGIFRAIGGGVLNKGSGYNAMTGQIAHGSIANGNWATTNINVNQIFIGADQLGQNVSFRIAEFFLMQGDIGFDSSSSLPDAFVLQLAKWGPFSFPHIRRQLRLYLPFHRWAPCGIGSSSSDRPFLDGVYWTTPTPAKDIATTVWTGSDDGNQTANNQFWVGICDHPPLAPDYIRPDQTRPVRIF